MRVVFMGTPDFAVPALEALISAHEVAAVVTQPDKPKGRGKAMQYPPVKEAALAAGIPVYQPVRVRDEAFVETLKEISPDVIVVAAFGQILPESILNLPPRGCINIHASLLPKYRGAAPIQRAVINGEKESGITIMYMEKGLDTGDMIDRVTVPLDEKETGASLHDKLSLAGGPLILKALSDIEAGKAERIRQDDSLSSYAPMLTREEGEIDWSQDAVRIERLIRGMNSWPSAYTFLDGKMLKIWEADLCPEEDEVTDIPTVPGSVVKVGKAAFFVQCGSGLLKIKSLQLQGKKRMDTAAFLLGRKLEAGMVLGKNED